MTGMVEGDQHCGRPATRWFDDNGSTLPDGVELASTGRSGESHATVAHMNEWMNDTYQFSVIITMS